MRRITLTAAAALAAAGTATACSNSATSGSSTPGSVTGAAAPASTQPANPVPILKKTGAHTTAKLGQVDVYGDRYAQGDIPGATIPNCGTSFSVTNGCLESVEVYTYATAADQARGEQQTPPSDSAAEIRGDLFDVTVYPVATGTGPWVYPVSVATIAQRVGGTVLGG